MAVSSANNKHSSLNRRTADQTRHLLRQPISSNTSTSSLPVAAQRPSNVQSKGAQEFTSSSSLGLLVYDRGRQTTAHKVKVSGPR